MLFLYIHFIIYNRNHIHFRETNIQKTKGETKQQEKK